MVNASSSKQYHYGIKPAAVRRSHLIAFSMTLNNTIKDMNFCNNISVVADLSFSTYRTSHAMSKFNPTYKYQNVFPNT